MGGRGGASRAAAASAAAGRRHAAQGTRPWADRLRRDSSCHCPGFPIPRLLLRLCHAHDFNRSDVVHMDNEVGGLKTPTKANGSRQQSAPKGNTEKGSKATGRKGRETMGEIANSETGQRQGDTGPSTRRRCLLRRPHCWGGCCGESSDLRRKAASYCSRSPSGLLLMLQPTPRSSASSSL